MNSMLLISFAIPVLIAIVVVVMLRRSGVFGMSRAKQEQAQRLLQTGQKARARIVRIDPTGMVVNNINIQCNVTFQLEPLTGGAAFTGVKKMLINQTQMPRVGDVWPSWYDAADPSTFAVGMPDGASAEQIPVFREFGIPHPLDPSTAQGGATPPPSPGVMWPPSTSAGASPANPPPGSGPDTVADLERLTRLRDDGALTEAEFQAAKARLLAP